VSEGWRIVFAISIGSIVLAGPVFLLYEAGKKSEIMGLSAVALAAGEVLTFFRNNSDGLVEFFEQIALHTFGIWLFLFFTIFLIKNAIKDGEKEFYKDKYEYLELSNKDKNELTTAQLKRFIKLEKRKIELLGDFSPELIDGDR